MKVKYRGCKFSDLSPIVQELIITRALCKYPEDVPYFIEHWDSQLLINEEHEVLALETWIVRDKYVTAAHLPGGICPIWYPLDILEITDHSLRPDWEVSYDMDAAGYLVIKRITFPEWAHNDSFLGNLIDENDDEFVVYMRKLREYNIRSL